MAEALPVPESNLGSVFKGVIQWMKENTLEAVIFAGIGAAVAWVISVYLMAGHFEGYDVPPGSPVTGQSNLVSGSLFWIVGSTVAFGVIGYRRAVGSERFWREIRDFPSTVVETFKGDGDNGSVHLLWGFAGCMLATQFLSPSLSAVLAIGFLAAVPSILGDIISELLQRAWGGLMKRFAGEKTTGLVESISMLVVIFGAIAALALAFFVTGPYLKLGAAIVAAVLAFLLGRRSKATPSVTMLLIVLAAAGFWLHATPASADDGGWQECGGTISGWLGCGSGTYIEMRYALSGAAGSGLGAAFGGALGAVLGSVQTPRRRGIKISTESSDTDVQERVDDAESASGPTLGDATQKPGGSGPDSTQKLTPKPRRSRGGAPRPKVQPTEKADSDAPSASGAAPKQPTSSEEDEDEET